MDKQDKIKKVMREFKEGKLKTPDGKVVTDRKQALAIAMSESEDYAEKGFITQINIGSVAEAENILKAAGEEKLFEKAVYADTYENRKLGRVGREYGGSKSEDDSHLVDENGKINEKNEKVKRWRELSDRYDTVGERKKMTANEIAEMSNIYRKIMSQKQSKIKKSKDYLLALSYIELFPDTIEKAIAPGTEREYQGRVYVYGTTKSGKMGWRVKEKVKRGSGKVASTSAVSNKTTRTATDDKKLSEVTKQKTATPTQSTETNEKTDSKQKFSTKDYELWGHESSSTVKGYGLFNPDTNLAAVVMKDRYTGKFSVTIKKQDKKYVSGPVVEEKSFSSRAEAMKYGIEKIKEKSSTPSQKKPSSSTQNAHILKLIDIYKKSGNKYTDTSKMSIVVTPKGNWNLRYDGKDISTIAGQRNIMDRKTLEAAGIKFEDSEKRPVGTGTNSKVSKNQS